MKIDLNIIKQGFNLELLARQLVEGFITGLHKSPYHGFSVEFAEHRLYNDGESTRHIDWRVYARTDRLYSKRYEEETNLRCLIVLDRSPSMFYPTASHAKINFSVVASAALGYLLQRQRDAVGLCLFTDQIETLTSIRSTPTHLNKIFTLLEHASKGDKAVHKESTNVAQVLHEVAEKIHKRSLVMIFSDMFDSNENIDELFKSLQHLKHNKHEVIVFHVMDKSTEMAFDFEDKPVEFIDLESREKIKLNPQDVREHYRSESDRFYQAIKMRCNQYKIDYIEADVAMGYNQILQTYLIKRARMR